MTVITPNQYFAAKLDREMWFTTLPCLQKRPLDYRWVSDLPDDTPCACGANLGDHSHTVFQCPNPRYAELGQPLFLKQNFKLREAA